MNDQSQENSTVRDYLQRRVSGSERTNEADIDDDAVYQSLNGEVTGSCRPYDYTEEGTPLYSKAELDSAYARLMNQ